MELLTAPWLLYLEQKKRLYVGFSGGLDSTVLLHALATQPFFKKIIAVHVNHGLSPHALAWEEHCRQFCQIRHIPFISEQIHLSSTKNLEKTARIARYAVFRKLIQENEGLILAHHQNDQAETLLLQLFRGAGIDGLAGMKPLTTFGKGVLLRPFLDHQRALLQNYAKTNALCWIEDDSNDNCQFSRNFIRHQILPLIQLRWPKVINTLARTTAHCSETQGLLEDLAKHHEPSLHLLQKTLPLRSLQHLSICKIKNVLRVWLKKNGIILPPTATLNRIINEGIFSAIDTEPLITWGNYAVRRYQQTLYLLNNLPMFPILSPIIWDEFPKPLNVGAQIIKAIPTAEGLSFSYGDHVEVKFRQGGERLKWHGQTKSLKKLLQFWQIPPWLRPSLPLIYINEKLAAVGTYAISDDCYTSTSPAYHLIIEEK